MGFFIFLKEYGITEEQTINNKEEKWNYKNQSSTNNNYNLVLWWKGCFPKNWDQHFLKEYGITEERTINNKEENEIIKNKVVQTIITI